MTTRHSSLSLALASLLLLATPAIARADTPVAAATTNAHSLSFRIGTTAISMQLASDGVLHVQALPAGAHDAPTLVMNPHATPFAGTELQVKRDADGATLVGKHFSARWNRTANTLTLTDAKDRPLLSLDLADLAKGRVGIGHARADAIYGIAGYNKDVDASPGLLRSGAWVAKAGEQGHAGAPFVWSTTGWGLLVDTDGANFTMHPATLIVDKLSKPAVDVYLMVGTPHALFDELANLSGHAPMFPKWASGFINSQWGIDEQEFRQIIATYRAKHIPIDAFTFDFDWKNWGNDWGEFSWNPVKFPDGPTGKLKADMDKLGIRMTGIMKPRVHIDTPEGRYATAHNLWLPGEKASPDYFSHKLVKDIDFDNPAARAWWFNPHLAHSFDTGIVGWWNDEADTTKSNTQFLNMQRATYDGQRAHSDLRVWSINRDFWLGAQRYAYGLWSGDIQTGFASMAAQRPRMLSAIALGEMQWGMDGGGFEGHPSDENYARWIEFGAFTPIFRVHGTDHQKRQPWVYGPVAEAAATKAIRLRYALLPYIYSYQHRASTQGVGLVQPLAFVWPDDAKARNDISAWLFGDWLLVSPVVEQGQTSKSIYLPDGTWIDWFTGKEYDGDQTITVPVDAKTWADIPLFIRDGAIIPTQPVMDWSNEYPVTTVGVDVFPDKQATHFDYYDDDGETYAYQHGAYFAQRLSTERKDGVVSFAIGAPTGSYRPALKHWLVRMHGFIAKSVIAAGKALPEAKSDAALDTGDGEGWATGTDRYGPYTLIRLDAGVARSLRITPWPRR